MRAQLLHFLLTISQIHPWWNSIDLTLLELSYTGDEFDPAQDFFLFIFSLISFSLLDTLGLDRELQCKRGEKQNFSAQESFPF